MRNFAKIFFVLALCTLLFSCEFYSKTKPSLERENWQPFGVTWKGYIQYIPPENNSVTNYDLEMIVNADGTVIVKAYPWDSDHSTSPYDVYHGTWIKRFTAEEWYQDPDYINRFPVYEWTFTSKEGNLSPFEAKDFDGQYMFFYWGGQSLVEAGRDKQVYMPSKDTVMQLWCKYIRDFYELSLIFWHAEDFPEAKSI